MTTLQGIPFKAVDSSAPSFNSTLGSSGLYALQSTATNRFWRHPSNRAVRISSKAADDYSVSFGSSTIVATSSGALLILGGTVETFYLTPGQSHVSVKSSTDVLANFTLGHGS